ncbi:phosphate-binding protein [Affinibrenneria salicis]|uniref:Phosphate-binding protein n=1 Tax=Affinibrenneria salicis TaxID=2590031 RepID=A0A5J5G362_9GAMM|nr:substrate-binding domain-containing protein [Affinibrenneria salicis]KAA9000513.1 phosphate-binding protein [Affinibrenneria salicis]
MTHTRITIVGNDGIASLLQPWCALFRRQHAQVDFALTLKGSSTAIMALAADACQLAPMSRAPWAQELAAFHKVKGYAPSAIRLGYCGYGPRTGAKTPPAIYAHCSNPLPGLTMGQLAAVFSSGAPQGDITCWRQLGIEGGWQSRRIHLYGLRDDGKYASAFRRAHLANRFFPRHYEALPDRRTVIEAVANDPFGLGATGWFDAAAVSSQVRVVALTRREQGPFYPPSLQAVGAGNYPLAGELALWFDLPPGGRLAPPIKAFLQLALSDAGQAVIAQQTDSAEGYVALDADSLGREREKLSGLQAD